MLCCFVYSGTSDKGHSEYTKDTFQCTNLYSGNTFYLSIMDKMICPNVSEVPLYWKVPQSLFIMYIYMTGGHYTRSPHLSFHGSDMLPECGCVPYQTRDGM